MSSNQTPNMDMAQSTKTKNTEAKATAKAAARAQTPTSPSNRNDSKSPGISPKTQPSPSAQNEIRRGGGAFGKYTFGAEAMGWTTMGAFNTDPVRGRGASVMPEPETDERMKEMAGKGMKGGSTAKVESSGNDFRKG